MSGDGADYNFFGEVGPGLLLHLRICTFIPLKKEYDLFKRKAVYQKRISVDDFQHLRLGPVAIHYPSGSSDPAKNL